MPAGSIKLRSISPSSKEKCSRPTTFPRFPILRIASGIFKNARNKPLPHSNKLTRAKIFALCQQSSNSEQPLPPREKIRHRNSGLPHLVMPSGRSRVIARPEAPRGNFAALICRPCVSVRPAPGNFWVCENDRKDCIGFKTANTRHPPRPRFRAKAPHPMTNFLSARVRR